MITLEIMTLSGSYQHSVFALPLERFQQGTSANVGMSLEPRVFLCLGHTLVLSTHSLFSAKSRSASSKMSTAKAQRADFGLRVSEDASVLNHPPEEAISHSRVLSPVS